MVHTDTGQTPLTSPVIPMLPAPIPSDDADRLASLHALRLLDTPAEERFDRIARLASRIFRTPIAYVALVDGDRQWFKAKCGVTVDETGREISFCGHTILGHETLIIRDTHLDDRFHDNPLVTGEPYVRFYAGHPLAGPNGKNVGTLCIADHRPRDFCEHDRQTLIELAAVVERELGLVDMIRLQEELIQARERLARELDQAARYVRALLPAPLENGPISAEWCFQPSSELGGDAFGYHWIDDDHFAAYLLDVSGHGVGPALLSVSAMETLRAGSLPGIDFRDPAAVLSGLNQTFAMSRHGYLYFTIWYGVYNRVHRTLNFSTAGHPPAVLVAPDQPACLLGEPGPIIGVDDDSEFWTKTAAIPPGSSLFVYSDGAYEVDRPDGTMARLEDWVVYLTKAARMDDHHGLPDRAYEVVLQSRGTSSLADDFALLRFRFA